MSARSVLQVEDLSIDYQTRAGIVAGVSGINFHVAAGEVLAIVGESGSGKSTTASALIGLLADNARWRGGRLSIAGHDLTHASGALWQTLRGRTVGFVPQDPGQSLDPVKRIGQQLVEAMTVHGVPRRIARQRCLDLLERVGLAQPQRLQRRYPHQLSGGMRQRVLIAMAMANDPPLIIADEPTSALDAEVQRQVLDCLQELARERNSAVVLITHDLGVALERADHLLVMHAGRVVEAGPAREVFAAPRQAYTRALLEAAPARQVQVTRNGVRHDAPVILRASGLVKSFSSWFNPQGPAVDDVSFTIAKGSTTSLVGQSGSGKSTTARLLLGLERADRGKVYFDGHDVTTFDRRQWQTLRRRIQVVYQNPYASLNPRLTLAQIISEPLQAFDVGDRASRRLRAASLLEQVQLPVHLLDRRPAQLSGGQRQRVAIARALALEPELIVLDEPLSALDALVQAQIVALLDALQQRLGLSYLFISHDLATVRRLSDQVVVMRAGQVVEQGPCQQIFEQPAHAYTRQLLASIPGAGILASDPPLARAAVAERFG